MYGSSVYLTLPLAAVLLAWQIARWLRDRRRLQRVGRALAALPPYTSGHPGPSVVEGTVVSDATLIAPLSGEAVVGYHVVLEARYRQRLRFEPVLQETQIGDLGVASAGGLVEADRTPKTLLLQRSSRRPVTLDELAAPPLSELLRRQGVPARQLLAATRLRLTERTLRRGDRVYVYNGVVRTQLAADGAGRGHRAAPERTVLQTPAQGATLVTDLPPARLPAALGATVALSMDH